MADIEFVNGLSIKPPHERAPEFVKAAISIKVADMMAWLQGRYQAGDEWVNVDVKEARSGKWYASVNAYKPKESGAPSRPASSGAGGGGADMEDIPFAPIGRGISGHSV
jgi:hypothetical protein